MEGPGAVCSGQADVQGLQDGQNCSLKKDGEVERNSTDPLAAKKRRLQTADLGCSWTVPLLSWAERLRGRAQSMDCLRLLVNTSQSQQARGRQVCSSNRKVFLLKPNSLHCITHILIKSNKTDCTSLIVTLQKNKKSL